MTRLDAIEARVGAATEGVWEAKHPPGDSWVGSPFNGPLDAYRNTGSMGGVAVIGVRMDPDDAAFIAHARTDVPLLLAAVKALVDHCPFVMTDRADSSWLVCSCGWNSEYNGDDWHGHITALAPLLEPEP